jgi:four helix bundle protein
MGYAGKGESYRKLEVWRDVRDLAVSIYQITRDLPPEEKFGLSSQLRRASVSVVTNIVEGYMRGTRPQFRNGARVARASLAEVECLADPSAALGLLPDSSFSDIRSRIQSLMKRLNALVRALAKGTADKGAEPDF